MATTLLSRIVATILAAYARAFTTVTKGYAEMSRLKQVATNPTTDVHLSHRGSDRRSAALPTRGTANMAR